MATYAKILKDNSGNFILPYTRSKFVYMDDNTTVETAINNIKNQGGYTLPTASSSTLGGVKIGSNISVNNGKISLTKNNITSALGYTPATDSENANYNHVAQTIYIDSNNANNAKTYSTGFGSSSNNITVWGCSQGLILGSHNEIDPYPNSSSTVSIPAYNISGGLVCGSYCNSTPDGNYAKKKIVMLVGNGSSSAKSNSYRRNVDGTASGGTYSSNGADYAEYFEWYDGNINNEDRRGLFVTLNGDKIKLASKDDTYILGIISGNPTVIGDSADLYWKDQYKRDIYGSCIHSEDTYNHLVLNPDYDPDKEYIPRSDRKEWDPVGLMGKLICIDDGTCEVNGYCYPSTNGIGTKSDHGYRVMNRIDDTHIQVLLR